MAQTLNNLHAAPFQVASSLAISVTDSFSSRNVTVATGWYRTFLADVASAGTATAPKEFLTYVESLLNAAAPGYWNVELTTTGFVKITYVGGINTASISWTDPEPRNLLGFTGTLNFAAPGASNTASYHPTHCLFAVAKGGDDTDYSPELPGFAAAVTVGGVVDTLADDTALLVRRMKLVNIARTWTDRTANGTASTPAMPEDISVSRATSVGSAVYAGIAPPWSVHQHLYAARSKRCAFTDALQTTIASPSGALYDVGYVHPETYASAQAFRPAAPGVRALVDRNDLVITLVSREALP